MRTTATTPQIAPYFSKLGRAASSLAGAVLLIKPSEIAARLLKELRRTAALDAGEKL